MVALLSSVASQAGSFATRWEAALQDLLLSAPDEESARAIIQGDNLLIVNGRAAVLDRGPAIRVDASDIAFNLVCDGVSTPWTWSRLAAVHTFVVAGLGTEAVLEGSVGGSICLSSSTRP